MDIKTQLGLEIRKVRLAKGYSQEKLAEISKLHRTYIGGVERGERNIGIVNLQRIADSLEIKISELFQAIE